MAIPRKVQEQAERSDELLKKAQQEAGEEASETSNPETQEPAKAPPVNEEAERLKAELELTKQKYSALQGKYDSEMPRLHHELNELKKSFQEQKEKAEAVPEVPPLDYKNLSEEYGEEFVSTIQALESKLSAQQNTIAQLVSQNSALENQLRESGEKVNQMGASAFTAQLDNLVPQWREINNDPRFLNWLAETDVLSGRQRQDLLSDAESVGDAQRVATILKTWAGQQTSRPQGEPPLSPAASGSDNIPRQKPIFSRSEIHGFFTDVSKGKYRGREEEAQRIEQAIHAALQENRVR